MRLNIFCWLVLLLYSENLKGQVPAFIDSLESRWVDSVFQSLTPEERIGQLFMIPAYSNRDSAHVRENIQLIEKYQIGGVLFFQGGPNRQAKHTNAYQDAAKVPVLIAIDGEWGLSMRLDSVYRWPYQMTLGAVQDTSLIYQIGMRMAENFRRLGVHINFAPVVDVNNNPLNPVINYRSFGENKYEVAKRGIAYARGLQDHRVLAVAKHFPGHGDTDVDSHYDLPVLRHNRQRLDTLEMYPFKELINANVGGVMVAHLHIPKIDSTPNLPTTLSKTAITTILKDSLQFKGLVITDAMNMKGVTKHFETGKAEVMALAAGNDMIEFSENVEVAINAIKDALANGILSQREIDEKCRKVLALKYWLGLDQYAPVELKNLIGDLNNPQAELVLRKLSAASLTLLKNNSNLIPLKNLDSLRIASLSIGSKRTAFQSMLNEYTEVQHFNLGLKSTPKEIEQLEKELKNYNLILVGLHQVRKRPTNNDAYPVEVVDLVNRLAASYPSIITVFRNPYTVGKFDGLDQASGLIVAYEQNKFSQEYAAQLIFGAIGAKGKLPVSIGDRFKQGDGLFTKGDKRMGYSIPEEVGIKSRFLIPKVDSLVHHAIAMKATPGAQVLIAKDQKVILWKSYGLQSYMDTVPVRNSDIYDLASITKVSAILPPLMKLKDEGRFRLDATLGEYLPYFRHSDKDDLSFREMLAHQARLKPWIPYWKSAIKDNGKFRWFTFKRDSSSRFPHKVAEDLYLHRKFEKRIFKAIKKSPLEAEKKYLYSGLSFYLYPAIIERLSGQVYEEYLYGHFYRPLGATTLRYSPFEYFDAKRIIPTEYDLKFRSVLIEGRVHDEGAALMEGISGNAGLFGNANDLAKLFQMYLNYGKYGGRRYIDKETIEEFTSYQFPENENRRGLGFDKPALEYVENGNTAEAASPESFGHTGFTGTRVWADPKYNLLYIFLSNRVHPTRENKRLYKLNTRTKIEEVIYEAIMMSNT